MAADLARAVRESTAKRENEMLGLLHVLVDVNSFTANIAGCNEVADAMEEAFKELGMSVERVAHPGSGDCLVARTGACKATEAGGRQIMLCGHMDTVFPPDGGFTSCDVRGDKVHGPGVIDMKGGLVAGVYALHALRDAGVLDDMPVAFVCNADEETGSLASKRLIGAEASKSAFALVFECGGMDDSVVTGRKGKATYKVAMQGQAGHAGNLGTAKSSAVLGLAHAVVALEGLNDADTGSTVNVGVISGGTGPNTVPRSAEALVDSRFMSAEAGRDLFQAILGAADEDAIAERVPGVTSDIQILSGRPAWESGPGSARLLEVAREAGQALGMEVRDGFRGGVSDANMIGAAGVPCLDGMGPLGEFDHSENEYMVKSSLADRAALAALTMARAWDLWTRDALFARPEG